MNTTFALIGDTLDTFATALGLVWMQKAILNKRTSLWFAGFGLEFFAGIAHIFVLPYANLVLLTSTSSLAVVFSVMLAIGVLGEKINPKYDIASVVLIVTGSVLTIGLANPSDKVFTKNTVKQRLTSTASIWFLGLAVVTYAATALVVRRFVKRLKQVRGEKEISLRGVIRSVSLSGEVRHPKLPLLMLTFATGISSAINQAVFKFFGEILQSGDAVLFSPFEMALLMWGVLQSLLTLLLLNVAVYLYEQIDVAPFYQAFLTIFKILTGLVVLGEASYYDWKGLMTVAACASLIVAGIAVNIIKTQSESHVLYPLLT